MINYNFIKNKEIKNASWLILGKIAKMFISLCVTLITARYLGPSNYGLINYASAYVTFFMAFCTLGINSVIIKEFFDHPTEHGLALGSSIVLRIVSSLFSSLIIILIVGIIDYGEPITIAVVAIYSCSLIFHAFDTINYWFQSQYRSKVTAIITFVAYVTMSVYKIALILLKKDVRWFALATTIDYIVIAILLYIIYYKSNGPKLTFSVNKSKSILKKSYHYIASGMMVAIYSQTDKLMLKQMLGESSVGYYAAAFSICNMWVFVLQAIIDSIYPTIMEYYNIDKESYLRKNRQLYAIVFYMSLIASIVFTFLGNYIIKLLYGDSYSAAIMPLKIITWYTAFSYLGVARNAWIVCEGKQKYLKYIYFLAVGINILLNYFMIPVFGVIGAAIASLVTQIFTSIILPLLIKELRPNAYLMFEAITLKDFRKRE